MGLAATEMPSSFSLMAVPPYSGKHNLSQPDKILWLLLRLLLTWRAVYTELLGPLKPIISSPLPNSLWLPPSEVLIIPWLLGLVSLSDERVGFVWRDAFPVAN